jgi:hypothetical protein
VTVPSLNLAALSWELPPEQQVVANWLDSRPLSATLSLSFRPLLPSSGPHGSPGVWTLHGHSEDQGSHG